MNAGKRRANVRLERAIWEALRDIASREECSMDELVAQIDAQRKTPNLSAAIRNYIVAYYRVMLLESWENVKLQKQNKTINRCLH
jgi:predicted DNA-binding ribbon-helix-helix protein